MWCSLCFQIIILCGWAFWMSLYFTLYLGFWKSYLQFVFSDDGYISLTVALGMAAATMTIMIHIYYNNKSMGTIKQNLPSLGIIVSTREGLELFLKFLVTEFSVENLGILSHHGLYSLTDSLHSVTVGLAFHF